MTEIDYFGQNLTKLLDYVDFNRFLMNRSRRPENLSKIGPKSLVDPTVFTSLHILLFYAIHIILKDHEYELGL